MVHLLWLVSLVAVALPLAAQEWPRIELEPRWSGFANPVLVTHAGDGSGRLFVVEQSGRIRLIRDGVVQPAPFLDLSDRVTGGGERGLLGLAFPPGYGATGRFYVHYSDLGGDTVVARYRVSGDPDRADPSSEEIVLTAFQPFSNHNGGQIAFGPDGYLYVGLGDGGSGGDPLGNGQNRETLLGSILRLDVESGVEPYAVPASNPFVGVADVRPEIWAWGLRNPWRFAFDRETGDLWIADVGQNNREEVNFQNAGSAGGENYGWNRLEGTLCFVSAVCSPVGTLLPIAEYTHAEGCSVTGGHVVRDPAWPRLDGIYLYGDFCSGVIWGLRRGTSGWEDTILLETDLRISSFGEDERGTVYVVDYSGSVFALVDVAGPSPVIRVVPAVAHLAGAGGTPWRTTLAVVNRSGAPTAVNLVFRDGTMQLETTFELAAGRSRSWRNVLVDAFALDLDASAAGAVEIRAEVELAVTARVYADQPGGTYGQHLPALGAGDGFGPGDSAVLPLVVRSERAYTNVGAVNLGSAPCSLLVGFRNGDGSQAGATVPLDVPIGEWRQLFDPAAALGELDGYATVDATSPECRAWAYASVIDRDSRDPTTIPVVVR